MMDALLEHWYWILPGLLVLVGGSAALHGYRRGKALRLRFFQQLEALGARRGGRSEVFSFAGSPLTLEYHPARNRDPSRLSLTLPMRAQGSFLVERRGLADKLFERLASGGRITTSDPAFDDRWHLVSDTRPFVEAFFRAPEQRLAVAALFGEGCSRVVLAEQGLQVLWTPFPIQETTEAGFLRRSLPHLTTLAEAVPATLPPDPAPTQQGGLGQRQFDTLFAVSFSILSVLLFVFMIAPSTAGGTTLDLGAVFWHSLTFSLPLCGIGLLLAAVLLRRRSWFRSAMTEVVVLLLLGGPSLGYLAVLHLNRWLDAAPPSSWRPGHALEELTLPGALTRALLPGRNRAVVVTRPGRLGHEWVVDLRFEPAAAGR